MDPSPGLETLKIFVPPIQLTALAVWSVVAKRDFKCYGRVVEFLEAVNGRVPDLVAYRHFAKLVLGLKAKIILEMFLQDSPTGDVRSMLDQFFMEGVSAHTMATSRDSQKVCQIQQQFRELVLHLLIDPHFRASFLQEEVQEHYGEEFLDVLQKLLWEYLQRLEGTLPRVRFDQLREVAQAADPRQEQFLIGCLKELDPRSLQLLGLNLGTSHPQDQVVLEFPSEVETVGSFWDDGCQAFPMAWRSPGPRGIAASPHVPGEDGQLPRVQEGREEGGEGSGRGASEKWMTSGWGSADGDPERQSSRPSPDGAETRSRRRRGITGGETPDRSQAHSDLRDVELQHFPVVLVETLSSRREVEGSPARDNARWRDGRTAARKRSASGARTALGNGDLREGPSSDLELPRPWRLTRLERKVRARGHGCQDVPEPRRSDDWSPRERTSPSVSPSRCWRLRRRTKEKENAAELGLARPVRRCLDVAGPRDRLQTEHEAISLLISGPRPHSAEPTDIISDSEDESRDPLTFGLGGKGPLQLYHRTKHDTFIPTLVQHLRPSAMYPCYVALERMSRPAMS